MTSFRDTVLNFPRSGLSLAEASKRHDHLANLPPELFEMAEQTAGAQATFADKLRAFVVGLRDLLIEAQAAEAAQPATKPAPAAKAKPTTQVPVHKSAWAKAGGGRGKGAQASETSGEEFAAAADAIALSEGIDYGTAMLKAAENDPAMAERYANRHVLGAERTDLPPIPVPFGHRLIDCPADEELAERSATIASERGIDLGEAMSVAVAEDEALASRYLDFTAGRTALDELAERAEQIVAAANSRDHMSMSKAVALALSEDPTLKTAVSAYYERT